jgi:acetyl esterase
MGHSAGGTLAIAAVMEANRIGGFVPASLIVEYPPLDLYTDPDEKEKRGGGVPAERVRLYNLYYCDREYQKDAYASPVYATDEQLVHFPETLIITAGLDDLCMEGEEFALHLARCGNEVTIKRVQGAGHAFTIYRKEKHEEAFALILKYLKRLF